jgi:hypothetical protein
MKTNISLKDNQGLLKYELDYFKETINKLQKQLKVRKANQLTIRMLEKQIILTNQLMLKQIKVRK